MREPRPLPCPSVELRGRRRPHGQLCSGEKSRPLRWGACGAWTSAVTQPCRPNDLCGRQGRTRKEAAQPPNGGGGVSPRLERATLPRRSSSPRSRVSVGVASRSDPQGTPRIRAASPGEAVLGGRPAPGPRGGPQDRSSTDSVLARVEGAARGGAKAPEGREGPRGVASRRRGQGRPVIPRGRAKPRRGPRGGTRGARGLREAARRGWSQGRSGAEGRGHGRSRGAGPVPPDRGPPPVTVVSTRGARGRSEV